MQPSLRDEVPLWQTLIVTPAQQSNNRQSLVQQSVLPAQTRAQPRTKHDVLALQTLMPFPSAHSSNHHTRSAEHDVLRS
eukprot:504566-Rhodomonas_salina.1